MNSENKSVESLCQCGCGSLAPLAPYTNATRGFVKGKPLDFVHGHNRRKPESSHYLVDQETNCWVWQLGTTNGYGMLNNIPAARLYYTKYKGKIPKGLEIDHLCFNILCINPEHLEAVTKPVNMQRRRIVKLNEEKVRSIRACFLEGVSVRQLAQDFAVCTTSIYLLVKRRTWKNVV